MNTFQRRSPRGLTIALGLLTLTALTAAAPAQVRGGGHGYRHDVQGPPALGIVRGGFAHGSAYAGRHDHDGYDRDACSATARCGRTTCGACSPPAPHVYERLLQRAWSALAACDENTAADTFAFLIDADRGDARPRVGFALAEGLRGRDERAVRSMRRAVALDPGALAAVPHVRGLHDRIAALRRVVRGSLHGCIDDIDALFMLAALDAMCGDSVAALQSARAAMRYGDRSVETHALVASLERRCGPVRRYRYASLSLGLDRGAPLGFRLETAAHGQPRSWPR